MSKKAILAAKKERCLSIAETSALTGLSPHVLRMWELRYRWPVPLRKDNGYRFYPESLVETLTLVSSLIKSGRTIGNILRDQYLGIEERTRRALNMPAPPDADYSHIPQPESPEGQRIRQAIERAVAIDDKGAIARLQAESLRLRPSERDLACEALVKTRRT
jgi:DNA-binding transcriptional MerR regulator